MEKKDEQKNKESVFIQILKIIKTILKMIIATTFVFCTPFILPVILKILIQSKIFENVEEFNAIANSFYNNYTIVYIVITILILLWFFYKWEDVKKIIKSIHLSIKHGDTSLDAEAILNDELEENKNKIEITHDMQKVPGSDDSNSAAKILKETDTSKKNHIDVILLNESIKESSNINRKLMMEKLNIKQNEENLNIRQLEEENRNLRYYAAYNIINNATKEVLLEMYDKKYIELDDFRIKIINQDYKEQDYTTKNITEALKLAYSRFETIYRSLKFLNIVEPSEDNKIIQLTSDGKMFVKEYLKK